MSTLTVSAVASSAVAPSAVPAINLRAFFADAARDKSRGTAIFGMARAALLLKTVAEEMGIDPAILLSACADAASKVETGPASVKRLEAAEMIATRT